MWIRWWNVEGKKARMKIERKRIVEVVEEGYGIEFFEVEGDEIWRYYDVIGLGTKSDLCKGRHTNTPPHTRTHKFLFRFALRLSDKCRL